ncbi:MAG: tetratricopeptide repeat protein [Anaerolineae bacterium]|nr:tetratricopeptide repeat protein [Anaerolineae bacterium]
MAGLVGGHLGDYELLELIGEGGMASVYRGRLLTLKSEFALKVIHPDRASMDQFTTRFAREIQILSSLHHPHIVRIIEHGEQDGLVYLVMELLTGGSLRGLIQQGLPALPRVEQILLQVASALEYAHRHKIVHRDIKPQNILFTTQGEAKLSDFGIAKVASETTLTQTGMMIGTPAYMAPEQWQNKAEITPRTDVYALGIVLYEMLTGQLPFEANTSQEWMYQHTIKNPPSISKRFPTFPPDLDAVFQIALAKRPERRFSTPTELVQAYQSVMNARAIQAAQPTEIAIMPQPDNKTEHEDAPATSSDDQDGDTSILFRDALARHATRPNTRFANPLPLDIQGRFRDRLTERSVLADYLNGDCGLIGIYGRGGVGKTALACKVLLDLYEDASEDSPHGIVFLAPLGVGVGFSRVLTDFAKVLEEDQRQKLIEVARSPRASAEQKTTTLLEILGDNFYILFLDNLETLIHPDTGELIDPEIATFIEVALSRETGLKILVTSRDPLILPEALKARECVVSLEEGLGIEDGIDLLRGNDPQGTLGFRDASWETLSKLVAKVRGFPRALEALIGLRRGDSQVNLDKLLDQPDGTAALDSNITFRIVQQAIDQLSPSAIRVMEALAVCEVPVTQAALESLLSPYLDISGLSAILNRLAQSYFVIANPPIHTFGLHPIDREYCYEHIPLGSAADKPDPAVKPAYTRTALHYRAAEFYHQQRGDAANWQSIEDLAPHLAEFDHLTAAHDFDAAAKVLFTIDRDYLDLWGHYRLLISLHERLRGKLQDEKQACQNIRHLGRAYYEIDAYKEAEAYFREGLEIAQRNADRVFQSHFNGDLGSLHHNLGDNERASHYYGVALQLHRELGNKQGEASVLNNLCNVYFQLGQYQQIIDTVEQAFVIHRELGDKLGEANAYVVLGIANRILGKANAAVDCFTKALGMFRELKRKKGEASMLANLGVMNMDMGQLEDALSYYHQALTIAREIENRDGQNSVLINLGLLYYQLGQYEKAIDFYQQALDIARQIDDKFGEGICFNNIACSQLVLKQYDLAIANGKAALAIADELKIPESKAEAMFTLASTYLNASQLTEARDAITKSRDFNIPRVMHGITMMQGVIRTRLGDHEAAQESFQAAINYANDLLKENATNYDALYTRAVAQAGLAYLQGNELQPALQDIETARNIYAAPGTVMDMVRLVDALLLCPNAERLQPVRSALLG